MSTEIRIALIFQQEAGTQALRTALANAGVIVAVESRASELDPKAVFASDVDAIVVNLDAELEELLDEVTDALDSATQPVIYNDPAASSDLSGWDRARWMRHLSAKLKGQTNVTPPPPPGAELIPVPLPKVAQLPEPALLVAETASIPQSSASTAEQQPPATAAIELPFDLGFGDLDLLFDGPAPASGESTADAHADLGSTDQDAASASSAGASADTIFDLGLADFDLSFEEPAAELPPGASLTDAAVAQALPQAVDAPAEVGLADLDAMFDTTVDSPVLEEPPHKPQMLTVGDDIGDLDALFADAPVADDSSAPAPGYAVANSADFELDSLFGEFESPPTSRAPEPTASTAELTDLDALFKEFEASQTAAQGVATPAPAQARIEPERFVSSSTGAPKEFALDWSLEPVEDETPKTPQGDRVVAEWRLDEPSKPLPKVAALPVSPPPSLKPVSGPSIPAHLEASLALADLKLLDETELDAAPTHDEDAHALAELESLHLSSVDLGSDPETASSPANAVGDDVGLADLDFDLDLGSSDLSTPAVDVGRVVDDADLGDLDSLFEPAAESVARGISLVDLNRVFVLGASIGGPEAIKAFLAKLPASVPAAFIIAQHMGAEFLEMMATQLNAASALSVRVPKVGERLRHGEVIVAPANEQLTIDESGRVQLSATSSGSPYNPSIDQLAREAANRFGDHATLILFSGMGSDAVEGGRYLASRGGQVWAQDRASCVIASMIDSAKSQGLIRFEGTPAQLAERVLQVVS